MSAYAKILECFKQKSPFAVLVRSILQRLLPPEQLDRLFEQTADKQYQQTLLFSTLMPSKHGRKQARSNTSAKRRRAVFMNKKSA